MLVIHFLFSPDMMLLCSSFAINRYYSYPNLRPVVMFFHSNSSFLSFLQDVCGVVLVLFLIWAFRIILWLLSPDIVHILMRIPVMYLLDGFQHTNPHWSSSLMLYKIYSLDFILCCERDSRLICTVSHIADRIILSRVIVAYKLIFPSCQSTCIKSASLWVTCRRPLKTPGN